MNILRALAVVAALFGGTAHAQVNMAPLGPLGGGSSGGGGGALIPNISTACGSDATTAIQAALNGVGYAFLPACPQSNPLLISATLNVPTNGILCGLGHTSSWIKEPNTSNLAPIIQNTNAAGAGSTVLDSNITLCGFAIDGNGLNQTATANNRCINMVGVQNISLNDIQVTNCRSDAIVLNGNGGYPAGPCKINNIFIDGTIGPGPQYGYGLWTAQAQRWCSISNAYIQNTAEAGALVDASENQWSNIYTDNVGGGSLIGTSSGTTLTVTSVSGFIAPGNVLVGPSVFATASPITIVSQQSGTTGGPGSYTISASVTLSTPTLVSAIGAACLNSGAHTVNNPGGGSTSQSGWIPCPAGMWVRNVTNVNVSNSTFTKGSYYGLLIIGARHATFSNNVVTNNSEASVGVWDDIHYDLNVFLATGYGENHAIAMSGASVGANGQTLSNSQLSTSPATSRYGLFIADGLAGSVADAAIVAGGTSYAFGNTLSFSGGTETQLAQFTIAAAPGGVIATNGRGINHNFAAGAGVYTVLPANPVTITGGAGTGATANIFWSSADIRGIDCGPVVTACSRLPAFQTGWNVQTNGP